MIDWYKEYDRATFMADFASVDFRRFDPYYKLDKTKWVEPGEPTDDLPESLFDDSNVFSQMYFQFNLYVREQSNFKKLQDPFSKNCLKYARQACILMTRELMQAHLIVTSNEVEPGKVPKTQAGMLKKQVISQFKRHCMHIVSWGNAELFYIFTVSNLVQTNDTTKFYRERVLQIALRILHAEIYLWKYIINGENQDVIKQFVEVIQGRIEYKFDLTQALMAEIRHYEMVNPIEVETFSFIHKLQNGIINNEQEPFNVDDFIKRFHNNFFQLLEEMKAEPIQQIKEELRSERRLDLDNILRRQFNIAGGHGADYEGSAYTRGGVHINESMQDTQSFQGPRDGSPDETQVNQTQLISDFDDNKSALTTKSKRVQSKKKNIVNLKLIHQNVLKSKDQIDKIVDDDNNIDLAKIRKTFKNLINDQRFQQNYEKIIKNGNPQLLNAKDRKNFEKRQHQVNEAKTIFTKQVQKKPRFHLQNILDNLRKNLDQQNALDHQSDKEEQVDRHSFNTNASDNITNNVDQNMFKGAFRKKQGVVKNERQMPFYYEESSKRELPYDLVDYYLKERFNIVLGDSVQTAQSTTLSTKQSEGSTSAELLTTSEAQKRAKEANNIESRAKILENPVYQKMPFYPYKDLLMWQEVEKQRMINMGSRRNDLIFQQVRNAYLQVLKENVNSFLQRNPRDEKAKKLLKHSDNPGTYLKALFGDIVSPNDLELLRSELRKDLDSGSQLDQQKQGHMRHSPDQKTLNKLEVNSFNADVEMKKYVDAGELAFKDYFKNQNEYNNQSNNVEKFWSDRSNEFDSIARHQQQSRIERSSVVHSIQDSRIWSDGGLGDSRLLQDDIDQENQSLSKIYGGGGGLGVNDTTQQVINQNIQGVAPSQTVSFVENLSDQFEALFNLDQIQDAKLHDGVNKRNKANPSKYSGTLGGDINGLFGARELDQKEVATDRRPIRIKDVSSNTYQ